MPQVNQNNNPNPGYPNGSYGYPPPIIQDEKPINWKKYIFLFLRNWYWFLITLGIALGIAFFKIRYTIPKYQATATLIIEENESSQDLMSELRTIRYFRRKADLANETAKLRSFTTVKRAVDSLDQRVFWTAYGRIRVRHLYKNPRFDLSLKNDSIQWFQDKQVFVDYIDDKNFRLYQENGLDTILPLDKTCSIHGCMFSMHEIEGGSGHHTYSFIINNPITLTKKYKNKLQVESDEESGSVITLKTEGVVGEHEVDFLNTLSNIFILSGLESKQQIAENTFKFIDDQIEIILDSLGKAEAQLLTFRLSNNVINLSREGEIAYERLKSFHDQKTQLKLQHNYYAYLNKYIEKRNDPQTIIAPTLAGATDQLLVGAVQELQALYEERENLDISLMTDNPGLENINERISSTRLRILEIVKGLIENNQLTLDQINIEEQSIIDQLKTLPLSEQQLLNIKRKYDLYNQFYTFLLEKRAEAGIQKASTISNIRILDPARHDQLIPVGADKRAILLLAILLGLFAPSVVLFLRDILDTRIRERGDITNNTDIPIIGILGHASNLGSLPAKDNPNSAFTESLRRIRTNLSFTLRQADQKVIMVTSSISGEGKTFSAANLASIFAMNQKKVIIVGCDLRKPALHRIFNMKNDIGVTTYLIGEKKLDEVISPTDIDNLFVLPAGPIPPNPAELIETKEMEGLFDILRKNYDYIVVDTPPIALVADSLSLAAYVDITLYLVRQNHSHKGVLEIANAMTNEEKLPKTFLLINDILPSKSMGMNYYYGYGKGYNYGYYDYNYTAYSSED